MYKRDAYINAIYYEKKLANRYLKEMQEKLDETLSIYKDTVDVSPMFFMIQFYRTRIDTYAHAIRLYRKHHNKPDITPDIPALSNMNDFDIDLANSFRNENE